MADVRLVVNPGRKTRDKINHRDVSEGEEFLLPESEANIEIALGNARLASDQSQEQRSFPTASSAALVESTKFESVAPVFSVPQEAVAPMSTESSAPLVGGDVVHDARMVRRNRFV